MKKPSLAIISSYDDDIYANSTYAQTLAQAMANIFDVTVFNLKTKEFLLPNGILAVAGDAHIDSIAAQLENFDLVNIQCEIGLYGSVIPTIEPRLIKLIAHSRRLIFTMHRVDTDQSEVAYLFARLMQYLRDRDDEHPYMVMTHTNKEKLALNNVYGMANVTEYPVCYLQNQQKTTLLKQTDPQAWKLANGFDKDDIIIGRFGVIAAYKDHFSVIKALDLLPSNYKMVFVGGAHPHCIRPNAVDPIISSLTEFLANRSQFRTDIAQRIRFRGIVNDDDFYEALINIDVVVVPHYESNQSASGVTSLALELGKRVITTYNDTFKEYQRYYPGGFEMFDIGNHFELRDKILFPKAGIAERAYQLRNTYTPEGLCEVYGQLYQQMTAPEYRNSFINGRLEASFPPRNAPETTEERHRREIAHAAKAFHDSVAVQNQLNNEKAKAETALADLQERYDILVRKRKRA